jgi:WD40 repeat protein/DNA replication protein DnaC
VDFDRALEVTNSVVFTQSGRYLSDLEIELLRGAWNEQTYEEIAEIAGYSLNYLQRDIGPKFWKFLSSALDRKLNKATARAVLTQLATLREEEHRGNEDGEQDRRSVKKSDGSAAQAQNRSPSPSISPLEKAAIASTASRYDWGEALDVSIFYGRTEELDTLRQWILEERCRLVALLGMGGIGKSLLAAKAAQHVQVQFEYVVWQSLRNAPPLETLLADLVAFLSNQQDTQAKPERLLHWLRTSRCLVILDNAETILQAGDRAGYYRPDYENYGNLFRLLGESSHQSCVILTSREKPAEISTLESLDSWVRSLHLTGSWEASLALIESKGLLGTEIEKRQLCEFYNCSPLALKIVASSIQSLFDGEIAAFLKEETMVFNGIRRLLDQQFERLCDLEQTIMYWLAINREWTSIAQLIEDIVPTVSRASVLEALESLTWRSLLEKRAGSYTQQPIMMEYVTERLAEKIILEIATKKLFLFTRHALLKATDRDFVREAQAQLILQIVLNGLLAALGSPKDIELHLAQLLEQLRGKPTQEAGYAAGNILNLLHRLQSDLSGYDFSNLTIWQAHLKDISLHQVNCAYSDLSHCSFYEPFGGIHAVAFSPDGQFLAAGGTNGEIQLWRVANRQKVLTLSGHCGWIWSIAFSSQQNLLASGSADQTIRLWDIQDGHCVGVLTGHTNWVWSVGFSPDGQTLVSGGDDYTVRLWDVRQGICVKTLNGHSNTVGSVSFCIDGQTIASGSTDKTIRLWNVQQGQCLKTLIGHTSPIWFVSFSPDGQTLVSGGDDCTVRLWDIHQGTCTKTLTGHTNIVRSASFSADDQKLATSSGDRTVRLWDMHQGKCLKTLIGHKNLIWSVAFRPQGDILASGGDDRTIKLWNVQEGRSLETLTGYTNSIRSIAFSTNGQELVSGSDDRIVRIWNIQTGNCLKKLVGHTSWVWSVASSPQGHLLASSSADQTVKLWDVQQGRCVKTLSGHSNWVWSVAFSPQGHLLASGSADQTVKLWDVQQGRCVKTLSGHSNWVWSVAFNPQGKLLASGSADQTVRLWNIQTGECLNSLNGHSNWVWSVAFNPQGNLLASGSADQTVRLWDVHAGECLNSLSGHSNWVWSVAFNPQGNLLASGSADQTVRLWDVHTGECLKILAHHKNTVRAVAFNLQGDVLASASEDETIVFWSVNTGNCIRVLRPDRPYESMNITGVTGLTDAQKATLKALGALEN